MGCPGLLGLTMTLKRMRRWPSIIASTAASMSSCATPWSAPSRRGPHGCGARGQGGERSSTGSGKTDETQPDNPFLNDHPALIERLKQASQAGDENTAVALRMFNELVDGVEAQGCWPGARR